MLGNSHSPQEENEENVSLCDSLDEWEAPIVEDALDEDGDQASHEGQGGGVHGGGKKKEYFAPVVDDEAEKALAGDEVRISFQLEDSEKFLSEGEKFFMGQTIEVLKMYLEKVHHLPYSSTTLYLNDVHLIDPLSLMDLPFNPVTVNVVKVCVKK